MGAFDCNSATVMGVAESIVTTVVVVPHHDGSSELLY